MGPSSIATAPTVPFPGRPISPSTVADPSRPGLPQNPDEVLGADREHRIRCTCRGPHVRRGHQVPVDEDAQAPGLPERRRPPIAKPVPPGPLRPLPSARRRRRPAAVPDRAGSARLDPDVRARNAASSPTKTRDLTICPTSHPIARGRIGRGPSPLQETPDGDGAPRGPAPPPRSPAQPRRPPDPLLARSAATSAAQRLEQTTRACPSRATPARRTAPPGSRRERPRRRSPAPRRARPPGPRTPRRPRGRRAAPLPRSDCSSNRPSPVITRSASANRARSPTASMTTSTPGRSRPRRGTRSAPRPGRPRLLPEGGRGRRRPGLGARRPQSAGAPGPGAPPAPASLPSVDRRRTKPRSGQRAGCRRRATRPGGLADLRTFELPLRVFRQRPPEAILIGTRCHVVDEGIVRIGDPVSRHRVVRRQQGVLAGHAVRPVGRAIQRITSHVLSVCGEIGRRRRPWRYGT